MSRVRVHVSTPRFTAVWQRQITPVVRRVVRNAQVVGTAIAPRGHDPRPGKSQHLYRRHGGFVRPGAGLKGKFRFSNSAGYATAVALGRGPVRARPGKRLKFPDRSGRIIYVKSVSAARGNQWMARSLRSAMVKNGLKPRVNQYQLR